MKTKILIVDDEPEIVEILTDLLVQKGYDIAKAYSQAEARTQIKEYDPLTTPRFFTPERVRVG